MKKLLFCICLSMILLNVSNIPAEVTFTDVAESAGFERSDLFEQTWGDYDNDGYADLFIPSWTERRLFHNDGNGKFRDVTDETNTLGSGTNGGYFLDFDNDGNLDLFMSGNSSLSHGDRLLRNMGDGIFVDVTPNTGFYPDPRTVQLYGTESSSFDYDNDGLLDIFVKNSYCVPPFNNILYHNEGNGKFKDIAVQAGLDDPRILEVGLGDYDNDGDLDMFLAVRGSGDYMNPEPEDQGIDRLYRNDGNGVYVDIAKEAGVQKNESRSMPFCFDCDNDGDLDIFLKTIRWESIYGSDKLYRNNGNMTFTDVAKQAGILHIEQEGISADYGDYDNDGWLDFCIAYRQLGVALLPIILYHNNKDGTFTEISRQVGLTLNKPGGALPCFVDYDNDGDLDIFVSYDNIMLYKNNGTGNHWLQLKLAGRQSNRDAIGAVIRVNTGELSMRRDIMGFGGELHQDHLPVHFGLGGNVKAERIEIRWPSGIVQTFTDVPADQRLTIDEIDGIMTVVRRVIPDSGHPNGGTAFRIQGESFLPGSRVLFNGIEAGYVRIETPTLITAVTPPGAKGFVDVEVVSPDGKRGLLKNGFRYSNIQMTKITPESGPAKGGIGIQIEGSGFQQGAVIMIGNSQLISPFVTPVLIQGALPAGISGAVDVSIINPDGETFVLDRAFTYIPPPKIELIRPELGPVASTTQLRINGSEFMKTPLVYIGGISSTRVVYVSSTQLEVDQPTIPILGPQDIVVTNPDGQSATLAGGLTIIAPPKIEKIEPASGGLDGGTEVTIIGGSEVEYNQKTYPTKFIEPMYVFFGEVEAPSVTFVSDHVIKAITPPNTVGPKDVRVVDPVDQDDVLEGAFTYNTLPQITKVVPNNGKLAGGTPITIYGSGFLPGAEVVVRTKDGVAVLASSVQVMSSTIITVVMPSVKPGVCDVTIINPDDQRMTFPDGFTYNPIPTITRIKPNYGSSSGGSKIIIEGTGFLLGARVVIGERSATTQVKDDMTIEAVTPSNRRGVWDVKVVNPDTQEAVAPKGFISVGELVYNYPNPFRASQGTTFRYVTNDSVQSITVRIFNLAGIPIDIVHQSDSNEVRWQNGAVHVGMYVYDMEVKFSSGEIKHFKRILEVRK